MSEMLYGIGIGAMGIMAFVVLSRRAKVGKQPAKSNASQLRERPLGLMERYYAAFDPPRLFCITLSIHDAPCPELDHVNEILTALCIKHPILSVGLDYRKSQDPPSFIDVNTKEKDFQFPVRMVSRLNDTTFQSVIDTSLNTHFNNFKNPFELLWRVVVVGNANENDFELVFVIHHLAGDGLSGVAFAQDFIQFHNQIKQIGKSNATAPKALPLPIEQLIDVRPSYATLFGTLFGLLTPSFLKKTNAVYLGPAHAPHLAPFKTSLVYISLDSVHLGNLSRICKEQGTTVHGALCAAALFACTKVYSCENENENENGTPPNANAKPNVNNNKQIQLSCTIPVSLLPSLPLESNHNHNNNNNNTNNDNNNNNNSNSNSNVATTPDTIMGVHVYGSTFRDTFGAQTKFWDIARRVKDNIVKNRDYDIQMNGMLQFVSGSWREFVGKKRVENVPNARLNSVEVSNLGRIHFPAPPSTTSKGEWPIKSVWFSQGNHYSGPVFLQFCCHNIQHPNVFDFYPFSAHSSSCFGDIQRLFYGLYFEMQRTKFSGFRFNKALK